MTELRAIAALMREERISVYQDGGLRIRLHESAFAAPALDATADAPLARDEELCACGCSKLVMHGELGCINGCDAAVCDQPRLDP